MRAISLYDSKINIINKGNTPMKLIAGNKQANHHQLVSLLALAGLATISACTSNGVASKPAAAPPMTNSGFIAGYLPASALPNSLTLLPAPPAAGSAAMAVDDEVARKSIALRGSPRWTLAIADAEYRFPQTAEAYTCALNSPINQQDTPRLYTLLQRTASDASTSTNAAKDNYKRPRPFVINKEPTCTPEAEKYLVNNGSYPSGHTAFGWAWALVLSEIAPEQANAILARGRAFGESRNVCNVHWRSDVVEGRFIATATVAVLHSDPAFRADLAAAKSEVAAAHAKGLKPTRDCAEEAVQLNYQTP
jgi:acid phosphatase (class A)